MPTHEYTPRQAFDLLLQAIRSKSPELAERIRQAVDVGKDVQVEEEETSSGAKGRRSKRYYRKNEPFTDPEALEIALTVIESHLVESRMFVSAAHKEFARVGVAPTKEVKIVRGDVLTQPIFQLETEATAKPQIVTGVNQPKSIEVEAEPETVLEKKHLPDIKIESIPDKEIEDLRALLNRLKETVDFNKDTHGNIK